MFDDAGMFDGYQGVARNVTERKVIEADLRARQEVLDLAQRVAGAASIDWTVARNSSRWSAELEALHGLPRNGHDGSFRAWLRLVVKEDRAAVRAALDRCRESGELVAEYRVLETDGTVRWLQVKGRLFQSEIGRPARLVGFVLDTTERKQSEGEMRRLERELRQAQRLEAIGTLAGGIAHDFNNILGIILGCGESVARQAPRGSRMRLDLQSILSAGERDGRSSTGFCCLAEARPAIESRSMCRPWSAKRLTSLQRSTIPGSPSKRI